LLLRRLPILSAILLPLLGGAAVSAAEPAGGGVFLDVMLAELWDLEQQGHVGTYPNGKAGLAAATTSCNVGDVDVPWLEPMDEEHPFIGLAMFREENGRLEQIGKNWIKHGFFALNDSQCETCSDPSGGGELNVGCSDTYAAEDNGNRYFLGPREEVNPHTGAWTACGSYFDEPVIPDGDCERSYFGGAPDGVDRRLEVKDADLDHPGAFYYYEGMYIVAEDDDISNQIGWREIEEMVFSGGTWLFTTWIEDPGSPLEPNPGPVVETWGDLQTVEPVASDDGLAILAVKATDLGGGTWHYDYALYNRTSARGIRSLFVPTPGVVATNATFRDIDDDAGNDWDIVVDGSGVNWSTDQWSVDPAANALEYQTLYNFRFDAAAAPGDVNATAGIFRPGTGSSFVLATRGPSSPVAAPEVRADGPALALVGANPFRDGTALRVGSTSESRARLSVVDVTGRAVDVLFDGIMPAGALTLRWDGRDAAGRPASSGVYFFRLETSGGSETTKGALLR
jgi:hypothetical protein